MGLLEKEQANIVNNFMGLMYSLERKLSIYRAVDIEDYDQEDVVRITTALNELERAYITYFKHSYIPQIENDDGKPWRKSCGN